MKFKYILIVFLGSLLVACEDRLEIEPAQSIAGEKAVSTSANVENVLIGAYDEMGQAGSYGGRIQIMSDLLGNGFITNWTGTWIQPRQMKQKNVLATNSFVSGFWDNSYESINQLNLVLDNLNVFSSDEAEARQRIEGEAKFLRGLAYFDLVRMFGSGTDGVPLRLTGISDYSQDLSIERSDVSSIYAQVIADLNSAYDLLPESNDVFADKYSAKALLARVYLQLGDMTAARDAADDVIANSGHALAATFAGAFNNDVDSPEDVFAFQVTSQTGTNQLNNQYADEGNGGRGGDIVVTDGYVALFADAADQRASFFYASGQSGERLTSKFVNQFANLSLIRLAEMYLIRAETNLALGTSVGADPLADLNTVRARSGASELTEISQDAIMLERVLELAFEGFAVHDLVRTQGSVTEGDQTFNFDSPKLTLPIPQSEMDTNPKMTQNPTY